MFLPENFTSRSLRESMHGKDVCNILAAALNSVDAGRCVHAHVSREGDSLFVDHIVYNLADFNRLFLIGVGKASIPMKNAMDDILGERITSRFVITKDGYQGKDANLPDDRVIIYKVGHPIPDLRNLEATSRLLSSFHDLRENDLVIFLLSGGGSALLTNPYRNLSLEDIQLATQLLLKCGAPIEEINTIRKHLDALKGGGLAKILRPATIITLILSDVVGDRLDNVASGPTMADPTTFSDAWSVLEKYQIIDLLPASIRAHIQAGINRDIPETIKAGDPVLAKVANILVGNNKQALQAASSKAQSMGFETKILTDSLRGEASDAGQSLAHHAMERFHLQGNNHSPFCLLAGGETTVSVKGDGTGGRNQELALSAVTQISGSDQIMLISLATDGGDGPTDAAGAVATSDTYSNGLGLGLDPLEYLENNDSYHYFEKLDDLIKTGPTLTNVNDLVFIFNY